MVEDSRCLDCGKPVNAEVTPIFQNRCWTCWDPDDQQAIKDGLRHSPSLADKVAYERILVYEELPEGEPPPAELTERPQQKLDPSEFPTKGIKRSDRRTQHGWRKLD